MAITAPTQWELRADGHVNNGGGFDPTFGGTDYSQQASPQLSLTDGSMSTANATLTSVTGGFTAQMVGNCIGITESSTFRGWWQITAFTSTNSVTVDRNGPVIAADCILRVGGAILPGATGLPPVGTGVPASQVVPGQTFHMRLGTYALTSNGFSLGSSSVAGTAENPIFIKGYNTTRGDIDLDPSLQRPVLTSATVAPLSYDQAHWIAQGLELVSTGSALSAVYFNSNNGVLENCVCRGYAGGPVATIDVQGATNIIRRNYVVAGATDSWGIYCRGTAMHIIEFNRIACTVGNNKNGIEGISGAIVRNNIISGFASGLYLAQTTAKLFAVENNVFYANAKGIQFDHVAQGPMTALVTGNIFVSNTTYDIAHNTADYSSLTTYPNGDDVMDLMFDCNFFYTIGTRYHNLNSSAGDHALTVDPFTDAASGDFSLNSTAGGGLIVRETTCTLDWADGVNSSSFYAGPLGIPTTASTTTSLRDLWRELTGEKDTTVVPDATVDIYLTAGLEALNRRVGYHLTTDPTTVALVSGTEEYTLPSDCVEVVFVEHNGVLLDKADLQEWRKQGINWRQGASGKPAEWAMYANKLVLNPRPNAAAVAEASACTLRYISTPPDFGSSGAEQLGTQDYRVVVYYGVAEWSRSYPDSQFAAKRADDYQAKFEAEAAIIARNYSDRGVKR